MVFSKKTFLTWLALVFKVAMFSFNVCWVPGKTHLIADALSRAPLFAPEDLPGLEIDTAISCLSQMSQPSIRLIYDAVDDDYRQLLRDIQNNSHVSRYSQHLKGSFDSLYNVLRCCPLNRPILCLLLPLQRISDIPFNTWAWIYFPSATKNF